MSRPEHPEQLVEPMDHSRGSRLGSRIAIQENDGEAGGLPTKVVVGKRVAHMENAIRRETESCADLGENASVRLRRPNIRGPQDVIEELSQAELGTEVAEPGLPVRDQGQRVSIGFQTSKRLNCLGEHVEGSGAQDIPQGRSMAWRGAVRSLQSKA
jgi:hypothetical protein